MLTFEIRDSFGREATLTYPDPDEQTCTQCGHEITPCVSGPSPRTGRYNGFAACPSCGAILWTIDAEDFGREEEEE